jgi:hypothetical protein
MLDATDVHIALTKITLEINKTNHNLFQLVCLLLMVVIKPPRRIIEDCSY